MASYSQKAAILRERLEKAFVASGTKPKIAKDIAFHLTDWDNDLEDMVRLYEHASELSDDDILSIIYRMLAHMPNHLAAAKKLSGMGPIEDVFNLQVCEEDEDNYR
jgi:hypothetical protein